MCVYIIYAHHTLYILYKSLNRLRKGISVTGILFENSDVYNMTYIEKGYSQKRVQQSIPNDIKLPQN